MNQVLPTTIQVIDEVDSLNSQYVFHGAYYHELSRDFILQLKGNYFLNVDLQHQAFLGLGMEYADKVRGGLNTDFRRGVVMSLGVINFKLIGVTSLLGFDIAYTLPLPDTRYKSRSILEVLVHYSF